MSVGRADNARFYGASGVPFVMGTTGGDREALMRDVEAAGVSAVIAPQMGKQARPACSMQCCPVRYAVCMHMLCQVTRACRLLHTGSAICCYAIFYFRGWPLAGP